MTAGTVGRNNFTKIRTTPEKKNLNSQTNPKFIKKTTPPKNPQLKKRQKTA